MRDLAITLEFVTPCLVLGPIDPETNCEYFDRDSQENVIWNQTWWYSAIDKTIKMFDIEGISPKDFIWAPTVAGHTGIHEVKYSGNKLRKHECFMPGHPVTFEAAVPKELDKDKALELFTRMGKYSGLSPYGYNLGFGKFNILELEIK
jgi:hypothetical protein